MNNSRIMLIIGVILISLIIIPCSFASDNDLNDCGSSPITDYGELYSSDEIVNHSLGDVNDNNVYVDVNGDDDTGDGSESAPYASIGKAINSTSASDMYNINVREGTYKIGSKFSIKNKNVIGLGNVVFDLNNSGNGFDASELVSFSNIKFINGNSSTYNYAPVRASTTSGILLNITNCTFENCTGNSAGAISTYYSGHANLIVSDSRFINCRSTGYGGAISVSSSRTANITGSVFENCHGRYGGAVGFYGNLGGSIISNSVFLNNSATSGPSNIYTKGKEILDYNFWGNNSKPDNSSVSSTSKVEKWAVLSLDNNINFAAVNNQISLNYDFTRYTDGNSIYQLDKSMPVISFTVSSKLGEFDNDALSTVDGKAANIYTPKNTGDETLTLYADNNIVDEYKFTVLSSVDSIIYVSNDGNDRTGDGSETKPYQTINYALSQVSSNRNIIFIKKGTYRENGMTISDDVTIIGEDKYGTVIDAENSGRIFSMDSDAKFVLKSLTLTNGLPDYASDDYMVGGKGGAVYVSSGSLILNNTVISNSRSSAGGAVAFESGASGSLTVLNSEFINNSIDSDAYDSYYYDILGAGALYISAGSSSIVNSTFVNNTNFADENNNGGAVILADSGIIDNCTFINNSAKGYGGAISVEAYKSSNINITDNVFTDNSAVKYGGAIYSSQSKSTTINSNTFTNNTAGEGGAIYASGLQTSDVIKDNVFSNNNAARGKVLVIRYANVLFSNNRINTKSNSVYIYSGKINSNLTFISNDTVTVLQGSDVNLTALLTDDSGNPISNGNITFMLNDEIIGTALTDDEGIARIDYKTNDTLADYTLTGTFAGSDAGYPVNLVNGTVKVSKYYWFIGKRGYFTLQEAVNASSEGDTVTGLPGIYYFSKEVEIGDRINQIYKNLTIKADRLGEIILTGVNSKVFNVASKNYYSSTHRDSVLNLENIIIENSSAEYAGAIYNDGYLNLNNCILRNNHATNADTQSKWHGGAILNWRYMTIDNCTFEDNYATVGGAIYSEPLKGNVSISNTRFINNRASSEAGAVYEGYGLFVYDNCTFIGNTAQVAGALAACADTVMNNTIFINNTAVDGAGAIYSSNGNFTANNITVINSTGRYGGAVYFAQSMTTYSFGDGTTQVDLEVYNVSNSIFENNHAESDGGAIFAGYNKISTGFLDNCTFINNSALGNGSAIANYLSNITVNNSRIINSTGVNGTIYNAGRVVEDIMEYTYSGYVFIYNTLFENNTAEIGGAVLNGDNISTVTVYDSVFRNISASDIGGAIYNNGYLKVNNNTMINCSSNTGNYIYNNGTVNQVNISFLNNETVTVKLYQTSVIELNATVTDDMGNPITGKVLIFHINGTGIGEVNVSEGIGKINYTIPEEGEYIVSGLYESSFDNNIKTAVIVTQNKDKTVFVYDNDTVISIGDNYNIRLLYENGTPLSNKTLKITIAGSETTVADSYTTDENGSIRISNLPAGKYTVSGIYDGDNDTMETSFTANLTVNKLETEITIAYTDKTLTAQLTDSNGKPVNDTNITITLSKPDKTSKYNLKTDSEGKVYITQLLGGSYLIDAVFAGTDTYVNSSSSGSINVAPVKIFISAGDMTQTAVDFYNGERGGYFNVTVKDEYGNYVANQTVNIGFNGVNYIRTTDENGFAHLQINLKFAGVYTFAVALLSTDEYEGSMTVSKITVTKKPSTLAVAKKTYKVSAKSKTITITLKGKKTIGNGYVPAKNKLVKVTVNGKTYTAHTNKNGAATVKVSINRKGTYTVTTRFAGDGTFNSKTTKSKLVIR